MRAALVLVGLLASLTPAAEPDAIEKAVTAARQIWQVPGVAVAIVQKGQPTRWISQGTKRFGANEPITPDTVFPLASCTKAFTSALVAALVDQGKMAWDDPVRKHLPTFALQDASADKLVTIRDLFQHRTGLGGHDLLWYRAPWGPEEVVKRISQLPLTGSFRGEFLYSSLPVTAAGFAATNAGGKPWEAQIREHFCKPLGMKSVAFTSAELTKLPDRATGHRLGTRGIELMPEYVLREPDPAGSMACSVRDLAPWMQLHLNAGKFEKERLVSAEELAETHTPATPIRRSASVKATHPTATQVSYAMGWLVYDHRGKLVVAHGGILDGFRVLVMMAPENGVGVAILANLHETRMNMALGHTLLELLLDLPRGDWNEHYLTTQKDELAQKAAAKRERDQHRDPTVRPSQASKELVGSYEHPAYGLGKLEFANEKLTWRWSSFAVPLEHWRGDLYRATSGYFEDDLFLLRVTKGKSATVVQRGIEFRRK